MGGLTRRESLLGLGATLGPLALTDLLRAEQVLPANPLAAKQPMHPARAKRVIMLFMEGGGRVTRVHGPFVSDDEVQAVADFLRKQGEPDYNEKVVAEEEEADAVPSGGTGDLLGGNSLYDQAVQLVIREQKASTSFVQRHLKIGYNRAATIIEEMEGNGIISAANHVGKREVLVSEEAG